MPVAVSFGDAGPVDPFAASPKAVRVVEPAAQSVVHTSPAAAPPVALAAVAYAGGLRQFVLVPFYLAQYGGGYAVLYAAFLVAAALPLAWLEALLGCMYQGPAADVVDAVHPRWRGWPVVGAAALVTAAVGDVGLLTDALRYGTACFTTAGLPWVAPDEAAPTKYRELRAAGAHPEDVAVEYYTDLHGGSGGTAAAVVATAGACGVAVAAALAARSPRVCAVAAVVFPVLSLLAALGRGLALPGAASGVAWLCFHAPTAAFASPAAWATAAGHALLTAGCAGSGGMAALASVADAPSARAACLRAGVAAMLFGAFYACVVGAGVGALAGGDAERMASVAEEAGAGLAFVALGHIGASVGRGCEAFAAALFAGAAAMGWGAPAVGVAAAAASVRPWLRACCRARDAAVAVVAMPVALLACAAAAASRTARHPAAAAGLCGAGLLLPLALLAFAMLSWEGLAGRMERHTPLASRAATVWGWRVAPGAAGLALAAAAAAGVAAVPHMLLVSAMALAGVVASGFVCLTGGAAAAPAEAVPAAAEDAFAAEAPPAHIVEMMTRRKSSLMPMPHWQASPPAVASPPPPPPAMLAFPARFAHSDGSSGSSHGVIV